MNIKNILHITTIAFLALGGCSKKEGCTDITATNFNVAAEKDDGNCKYDTILNCENTTDTTSNGGTVTITDSCGNKVGGPLPATTVLGNGLTDIDGNTYKSVIIGDKEWMAENLNTSKYNDGSDIALIEDIYAWYSDTVGAYSYYENDSASYANPYKALYNWYSVNTGKLCPTGWHTPSHTEWSELIYYLADNGHLATEGKALKAKCGWNTNGEDNYGFNGLPGGFRGGSGSGSYHYNKRNGL